MTGHERRFAALSAVTPEAGRGVQFIPGLPDEIFRHIVDATPHVLVLVDGGGLIRMVNAQVETALGYRPEALLGQGIEVLLPERFRAAHPAHRTGYFAGPGTAGMSEARDLLARRADGEDLAVDIRLNPIETASGRMVLATVIDISDRRKEAARLETALREQAVLLGEVHHRVYNNLQIVYSLLDLQLARIADPKALELLRDSQNRIRSMAAIHRTLHNSNDFAGIDFAAFIASLLPGLTESYRRPGCDIAVRVDVEPVRLPLNLAVPCGLMVNEWIANAFRHAFPRREKGEIRIALAGMNDGEALLSVADDGIGLRDSAGTGGKEAFGLQMVRLLTGQIKGTLSIRESNPTKLSVRFPV